MAGKSSVDKLKDRLYSRKSAPDVDPEARTPLAARRGQGSSSLNDIRPISVAGVPLDQPIAEETPLVPGATLASMSKGTRKKPHTFAFYFLWGSLVFFLIAAGTAAFTFFGGGNTISPSNIDLQIVAPSLVDSGKPVTLQYIIDNRNNETLQQTDLVIDYPDGTRDPSDTSVALPHERITTGDIASGQQLKETSSAVFYGSEGAQKQIVATLEYQIAGSNAIFVKQVSVNFIIGSAPISLSVSSPDQAIAGQPFSMDLTVTSNSTAPIQNVAVEGQYPFGFSVNTASPAADIGNTLWRLGTLAPGESQIIHLTGMLTGEDGDQRVFHFLVGSESDQTETSLKVPLLSMPQTVTVQKPFISAKLSLDGQTGTTIAEPLGKIVQGSIDWQNNLSESVSNLSFTLSLSGAALDPTSVNATNGFYDSTKNQIVWSSDQNDAFSSVAPGAGGSLQFSFATAAPNTGALINPNLKLNLMVHATRQNDSGVPESVSSAAAATVNLASAVSLSAESLHFSGPFSNTGPMPPKVGQQTTYTIRWTVKNSSNTIAGSQVKATLPPNVEFSGAGTAGGEQISYNSSTRTVTWSLGDVKAGAGFSSAARQAAFQVILTPSVSQVGQAPSLVGQANFSGQDRFAQAGVTAVAPGQTTHPNSDAGFVQGMDTVVQ